MITISTKEDLTTERMAFLLAAEKDEVTVVVPTELFTTAADLFELTSQDMCNIKRSGSTEVVEVSEPKQFNDKMYKITLTVKSPVTEQNEVECGSKNITITLKSGKVIEIKDPISKIEYRWDTDYELGAPYGYTPKRVEFRGSMTLSIQDSQELLQALAESGSAISHIPFYTVVSYGSTKEQNGKPSPQHDILHNCFITGVSGPHIGEVVTRKHDFVFCNLSQNGISVV